MDGYFSCPFPYSFCCAILAYALVNVGCSSDIKERWERWILDFGILNLLQMFVVCFLMDVLLEETCCYNWLPIGLFHLMWYLVQADEYLSLNNRVQFQRNLDIAVWFFSLKKKNDSLGICVEPPTLKSWRVWIREKLLYFTEWMNSQV